MKTYQFYVVKQFPNLKEGQHTRTSYQMTFDGEGEDVQTTISLNKRDFHGPLDLLRVQSQIKHQTWGFVRRVIASKRETIRFDEFFEPVDFSAFHGNRDKIVIFSAAKDVCRGVYRNVSKSSAEVKLLEMTVDFGAVLERVPFTAFQGAWFRKVSPKISAAGLHGDDIQSDRWFKRLLVEGELSNLTLFWELDGVQHKIMITKSAAVVFVHDFNSDQGIELTVAMDVYERLLKHVWSVKKRRKNEPSDDEAGDFFGDAPNHQIQV